MRHEVFHMSVAGAGGFDRPSYLGRKDVASIRYNNPGAMWPGPSSRKFGAVGAKGLNDGLGQGNKIAIFDDAIDGAAALFDLLDRVYTGMTVQAAIAKWSGGNWVSSYLSVLRDKGGIAPDEMITREKLRNSEWAIRFARAMAWHEAGKEYPLTDAEWNLAHQQAFSYAVALPIPKKDVETVMKESRKDRVAEKAKWSLFGAGGIAALWQQFKEWLGIGNDMFATASNFVQTFGLEMFAAFCIALAIVFNWFQMRSRDDLKEGRYTPSGAEE
jgi:hypothetical protein